MEKEYDIVIAGQQADPHVASVVDCLSDQYSLLIIDRYAQTPANLDILGITSPPKIKVYWQRDKGDITSTSNIRFDDFQREQHFDDAWQKLFGGIEECAASNYHPRWQIEKASNKIRQLAVARKVGLMIPETLCTNDILAVKARFSDHEKVLVKSITSFGINPGKPTLSKIFKVQQIEDKSDIFIISPVIVQSYVPKDYELRVTVVGDDVFACKIDSQSDPRSEIDWRITQYRFGMYEAVEVDSIVEEKLKSYLKYFGLRYGVFDLIVTPDHDTVFLECNVNGQWLFVERSTGMNIAESFARLFESEIRAFND